MSVEKGGFLLPKDVSHALVAYLIKEYKRVSRKTLGRTILQKLCYFADATGVPLPFGFEIYHYGPFSQEVFETTENLIVDDVIYDLSNNRDQSDYTPGPNCDVLLDKFSNELARYKDRLDNVTETFSELTPSHMELVSTIHYIYSSSSHWHKKLPSKQDVVESVYEIKKPKFDRQLISRVYDILLKAGLLGSAHAVW
jgi:uncharacterized protein YwgA